jgi:hypothetical protein
MTREQKIKATIDSMPNKNQIDPYWLDGFKQGMEVAIEAEELEQKSRTCESCKYYGCVDENIYSNNVCSQYQKVFINRRDGVHLLKCVKEPHNSCDLWESKDNPVEKFSKMVHKGVEDERD